jgi:hypothetical protein
MVQDTPSILKIAINFYKDLFKKEDRTSVSLRSDFWDPEDLVTGVENAELEAPFCEEEVRAAVFSCYSEGGGGLARMGCLFCFITSSGMLLKWISCICLMTSLRDS